MTNKMPQRSISAIALLFSSVSAILGSGWLFAAYFTSTLAGPATLVSWTLGGVAVIIVAFVFAELCAMLPITGSSTRIPQYTHGTLVSFVFSWMIWLSYAALVATEVQAVIQYLSFYFPALVHAGGGLTVKGYAAATILMLGVTTLNIYSVRWLMRCNSFLTIMKITIPTIIAIIILAAFFTPKHVLHPNNSSFMPFGLHGLFAAIASGGIIFAFNGFKQACEMAGEAKNPAKTLPLAIIGSVVICLMVYLLLQSAFLSSLQPGNLTAGWGALDLQGGNSPLAAILHQDNDKFLLPLLYIGAIIGPLAAALMYCSSAGRSLYGMSKNGYFPDLLQRVSDQGNPIFAIVISFLIGMCLFAPLPGWKKMISFLTSLMAVTYSIGPICLLALRHQLPQQKRPFKLPFGTLWATLAFYICTLLLYWSGWDIISKLSISLLIGLTFLLAYRKFNERKAEVLLDWQSSIWMWFYFAGMAVISYLGNFGGGLEKIPFGWDMVVIALFSIATVWLSVKFKLPANVTQNYINQLKLSQQTSAI